MRKSIYNILLAFIAVIFFYNCTGKSTEINIVEDSTFNKDIATTSAVVDTLKTADFKNSEKIEKPNTDQYSIKYLEDFVKFKNPQQVKKYFGAENVREEIYNYGAGYLTPVSIVYPNCQNQVMVVWSMDEEKDYRFVAVSAYKNTDDSTLLAGGNKFTYKIGLRPLMSLQELITLNGKPLKFNDFAFNLERQFVWGMVVPESMPPEFYHYDIHLGYNLPTDFTELPKEYNYLLQEQVVSTDDQNVNTSAIYVRSIEYRPIDDFKD